MISEYFAFALRNLRRRRLRSVLTVVGIVIAVATLFILVSMSLGLQNAVEEQFRLLGTDKFFIFPRGQIAGQGAQGAAQLTLRDVDTIENLAGVRDISYMIFGNAEVQAKEEKRYVPAVVVPTERLAVIEEIESYKAEEGRLLEKGDRNVVMIGSQYTHALVFSSPVRAGEHLVVQGKEFRVKAVLAPLGNPQDDRKLYLAEEDFRALFESDERVEHIIVQTEKGEDIKEVAQRVERKLRSARGVREKTQDFSVVTPEEFLQSVKNVLTILTGFLASIAAISLLVGSMGIATTMFTAVVERTREIGVMKAVGARNRDIALVFMSESGVLGLAGGSAGVLLGGAVSFALERIAAQQFGILLVQAAFPAWLIAFSLFFAFLIGALSGLWPARAASLLAPTEALRYE